MILTLMAPSESGTSTPLPEIRELLLAEQVERRLDITTSLVMFFHLGKSTVL